MVFYYEMEAREHWSNGKFDFTVECKIFKFHVLKKTTGLMKSQFELAKVEISVQSLV